MTGDGKLSIGISHKKNFAKLAKLTKTKDNEAVRRIVENVIFEAEQMGLSSVPLQMIGIKEVSGERVK